MIHLTSKDYAADRWAGGITTQLAIAPPEALYRQRDFLWRVSSATVDLEESDFTPLPDYNRCITVLKGSMTLRHDSGETVTLTPGQVHAFDGGSQTHAWGRCTDFNLMLQKGRCQGALRVLAPDGPGAERFPTPEGGTLLLYCAEGAGWADDGHGGIALSPGESVLTEDALTLKTDSPARFILAEMGPQASPSHSL